MSNFNSFDNSSDHSFDFAAVIAAVIAAVQDASRLALRLREHVTPDVKADQTLVTEADRQVENLLRERFKTIAPTFSFLGEEGGLSLGENGDADAPCWVIDPVDGTTNFVRGLPLWCVSVGVVHDGKCVFGCVAVPPQNELLWAAEGQGAWLQALSDDFSHDFAAPDATSSTRSSARNSALRLHVADSELLMQEDLIACNTTVESAVNFAGVPCRLRNFGSLAYHLVALSRGGLCAAISRQHLIYDIAGGVCICQEAGCIVSYTTGEEWRAEVVAQRDPRPLIVAPPQFMAQLLIGLRK